jgi:hypothetical protein
MKCSPFPELNLEKLYKEMNNNLNHPLQVCPNNPRVFQVAQQFPLELPPEWVLLLTHTPPLYSNNTTFLSTQLYCHNKIALETPYLFIIFYNWTLYYITYSIYT